MLGHFRTVAEREEPKQALHKLRVFTRWYAAGLPDGNALRRRIGELPDVPTFIAAVAEHFERVAAKEAA